MYAFPSMLDMGLKRAGFQEWKSDWHRVVAINACIGNPVVKDMDTMISNIKIIQGLSKEKVRTIGIREALKLGIIM